MLRNEVYECIEVAQRSNPAQRFRLYDLQKIGLYLRMTDIPFCLPALQESTPSDVGSATETKEVIGKPPRHDAIWDRCTIYQDSAKNVANRDNDDLTFDEGQIAMSCQHWLQ